MQTHVQAPAEQSSKQNQTSHKAAQLVAEPQTSFEDSRPQAVQHKVQQAMMSSSPQQQRHQALQAKMNVSARTQNMQTLQAKMAAGKVVQRVEEEEPLQAKFEGETAQREAVAEAPKPNNTGLPNQLKAGIESLSGMSMDHVKVHYNSDKPAQLNAHAYAQGCDIHVAPGQEQHLPHEAWHVVQQAQGRVQPTMQMKGGVSVNDDAGLEAEADVMGGRALYVSNKGQNDLISSNTSESSPKQLKNIGENAPGYIVQMVKVPPTGNFPRYVAANLTNSAVTGGVHPDQAEVAAEGNFAAVSAPVNSYGWGALNPYNYNLFGGTPGAFANTFIELAPRTEQNGNNYTRMHLIHHNLAANANGNINNMVLGPAEFNRFHCNHVENFMGDSMANNFFYTAGGSLHALLGGGENIGIADALHPNAGMPYVIGAPPTFPGSLLTGFILPVASTVPANAHGITVDEDALDRHVVLWYEVVPVFGAAAAALDVSMNAQLLAAYNTRPAADRYGEFYPAHVPGIITGMANALSGIYATALVVKASFYMPDPESIPAAGTTADQLPWRENRIPGRTLNNPAGNPTWAFRMSFSTPGGYVVGPWVNQQL